MNHPSIISVLPTVAETRRYPLGLPMVDHGGGALASGEVAVLTGHPQQGRTSQLLSAALAVAARDEGLVLILVCEERPEHVVRRLQSLQGDGPDLLGRIRVGRVVTASELAWCVAETVQHHEVAAVFVDDLPLLADFDASRQEAAADFGRLLSDLAHGRVAAAYERASGLPFGRAFHRGVGYVRPLAVLATARQGREGDVWGSSAMVAAADLVVTTGGAVLKSRRPQPPRAGETAPMEQAGR